MRGFRRFHRVALVTVVAVVATGLASLALAATGTDRTPAGWRITPAGSQVDVLRFPLGLTATPDNTKVLVSSDSGGLQGLTTIDASSFTAAPSPAANLFMGLAATPEGNVFASGGNADRIFRYKLVGPTLVPLDATEAATFPTHHLLDTVTSGQNLPASDGLRVTGYPGNMVLDGTHLYVAGTLSEQSGAPAAEVCPSGQASCGRVTVIDTSANGGLGAVTGRAPVGLDAYGVAVDGARKRVYASNWADQAGRGGPAGGTISVVDVSNPAAPKEIAYTGVGHHPSAIQLSQDRTRLFVANTNDDTISVLDVTGAGAPNVVSTESVKPLAGLPVGAHPNAFALSPNGKLLFVALADLNAIEVLDGRTGARIAGQPAYIPTGFYPASLLAIPTGGGGFRLWVGNARGAGLAPGYNSSVFLEGNSTGGTVSAVDVIPGQFGRDLKRWTAQVRRNDHLDAATADPCKPRNGIEVSEVLCPPAGKTSPIKHVLYIVTENKTFDQYFGDLSPAKGYDTDPSYALYGQPVTPNHHALADRYSLSDRFFSDADVSVTGHSWTSAGIATDHNEKTWAADYDQGIRGTHGGGDPLRPSIGSGKAAEADDVLQDPQGGYVFEAFKRAGAQPPSDTPGALSMAIYGEHTARESGDMSAYQAKGRGKDGKVRYWKDGDIQYFDSCRAEEFVTGKAPDGPAPDENQQFGDCSGRTLDPQYTLAHWQDVYNRTGADIMPSFMYMSLPDNHTLGTNLGSPTPASMVADNDHALGRIVDALSRSPFWKSTAVMTTEDDTQAAGDHISSLRDYLHVISPWARKGPNHQWGSMPSLLRTIETIFKVSPFTVNDKLALPQHDAFLPKLSDRPDLAPYDLQPELVPYALNQPGAPDQALSMAQNWNGVDHVDMGILNKIQYEAQGKPVPGG